MILKKFRERDKLFHMIFLRSELSQRNDDLVSISKVERGEFSCITRWEKDRAGAVGLVVVACGSGGAVGGSTLEIGHQFVNRALSC